MAETPTPGTVRARREIPELGVTVLTLSNGVEVWLKPTDFRNDQVVFTAYARGGTSTGARRPTITTPSLSTSLVGLAGLGGFTPVDLGKLLAGKIANAGGYMSAYTHGISGNATPRDLETALQLTHLHFTAPNRDKEPEAFELMRRRLEAALANQAQNPGLGVRRARARRQHDRALHREVDQARGPAEARSGPDAGLLSTPASPTPPTSRSSSSAPSRSTRSRRC